MTTIIGLTGSIGMGKSAASAFFRICGVPVFDADAAVHQLQGPGGSLLPVIERAFPGSTGPQGVDRQILGKMVLGHPERLRQLEHIVHPAVAKLRRDFLRRHRAKPMVVLDIPLLFEKGHQREIDLVAVVSAPVWKQRRRVLARPGMSLAKFAHIRHLQVPDAEKRRRADIIIDTGGTLNHTRAQIRRVVACIRAKRVR
ncbi:dephospho-CoA kinase [Aquisediminimonas sediminicola]|uniref:dephospho-CoA kinase n=1 Tax=Alteraquisediminimonas sediminicola TaxID=2676787 RepID=UPI001C8D6336|nr:dephospho-CoA kinase [Aquisediminimonas sediminicola]